MWGEMLRGRREGEMGRGGNKVKLYVVYGRRRKVISGWITPGDDYTQWRYVMMG
jgi:hypothetical protein